MRLFGRSNMSVGLRGDESEEELLEIIELAELTKETFGEEDVIAPKGNQLNYITTNMLDADRKLIVKDKKSKPTRKEKTAMKVVRKRKKEAVKTLEKRRKEERLAALQKVKEEIAKLEKEK